MTTLKMRPYQEAWINEVNTRLREAPAARVMAQSPTGSGKSAMACAVIRQWREDFPEARVFWVTHRRELIQQSADVLISEGVPAWAASADVWKTGGMPMTMDTVVSSPVTFRNRGALQQTGPNDLLVLDEAHHSTASTWAELLKQHQGPALGLTATPWRLSTREGFNHLYHGLVLGPQTADLINDGYLSSFRLFGPPIASLIAGEAADRSSTGEFSEAKVYQRYGKTILLDNALDIWERYGGSSCQTLVYALTVQHGQNLTELWQEKGHSAAMIHAGTHVAERDATMKRYRAGDLQTLVNVGIATEGFDIPAIGCVLILRPTASLALYLQMLGRGLRPNASGKPALLLDMTDNPHRLGRPDEIRHWSLAARKKSDAEVGAAITKTCWAGEEHGTPCGAVNAASAHRCEECGTPFGKDCSFCGRFRSWDQWPGKADRCTHCIDGQQHDHLSFMDAWRVSRKGNHYRVLDSARVLYILGNHQAGMNLAAVLYKDRQFAGRIELPELRDTIPEHPEYWDMDEAWWRQRQTAERWQGVEDRPMSARQLLKVSHDLWKRGEPALALTALQEAKAAFGADSVTDRIDRGIELVEKSMPGS